MLTCMKHSDLNRYSRQRFRRLLTLLPVLLHTGAIARQALWARVERVEYEGVSFRTFCDDLAILQALELLTTQHRRYVLNSGGRLLTDADIQDLTVFLAESAHTLRDFRANQLLKRFGQPVVEAADSTLVEVKGTVLADSDPLHEVHFQELYHAIAQQERIRIFHLWPGQPGLNNTVVLPLRLVFYTRGWYLCAFVPDGGQYRAFRLSRIQSIQPLSSPFKADKYQKELTQRLRYSWGMDFSGPLQTVRLKFNADAAPYIQEGVDRYPEQVITPTLDGGCLYEIQVYGEFELRPWVRSWGSAVEVLAPQSLREAIQTEAALLAERYSM
jgi:predicted DNA-binding transcriptional regulator YafY